VEPASFAFIEDIHFYPLTFPVIASVVIMVSLLCISALVSGSEVAFFSLSPAQVKLLRNKKNKVTELVTQLLDKPQNMLATILVANNFVNICIVILSTYIVDSLVDFANSPTLGFLFQVVIVTFLILLFGEIIPKIYATQYTLRFTFLMAYPLTFLGKLLAPINYVLISFSRIVDKRFKRRKKVSLDDISEAVDLASGGISEEKEILTSIMRLQKTSVTEIMRSRLDIVSAELSLNFSEIIKLVRNNGYSRVPVFLNTLDNIKGVLYVKDLIPHLGKPSTFSWQSLIRPPYYIPDTKKADSLLEEFQKRKIHMAIVVDEYGGTAGIVTLEDVIEEIVGEIHDENDDMLPEYIKINSNTYIFEGKYLLNDFCKLFDISIEIFDPIKGEADTLAGLILEIKGDFPDLYEEIRFKQFIFKIESEDKRRIKRIKVTQIQ